MDTETKEFNCTVCPLGCRLSVVLKNNEIESVTGFSCPRGKVYAQEEVFSPKRMLTSTVRIKNGILPLLPVVSANPLPKEKVLDVAVELRKVDISAPIKKGAIIIPDVLGLGVDILASRSMEKH